MVEEHAWVPAVGEILLDKYRVDGVIGRGGMGVVLAATHLTLEQRFAIKLLVGQAVSSAKAQVRFAREAQVAARIGSEHVCRVFDVGVLPNGPPYIVMEYLEGENLAELIEHSGRMPVDRAVCCVLQACEALAEAHREGIVHRDLKPANLFLARRSDGSRHIKVLDFGISKILEGSNVKGQHDLTKTSALMGSPLYMAPEQMKSAKAADIRSDIWSLGVILYELVTGVPPFDGQTLPEICSHILVDPPADMACAMGGAQVPERIERAIGRCLEKNPDARTQNTAELADEIAPLGGDDAVRSAQVVRRVLGLGEPSGMPSRQAGSGAVPPAGYFGTDAHALGAGAVQPAGSTSAAISAGAISSQDLAAQSLAQSLAQSPMGPGADSRAAALYTAAPVANTMPESPRSSRRPALWLGVGAVFLVAAAAVGWRAARREPSAPVAAAATAASAGPTVARSAAQPAAAAPNMVAEGQIAEASTKPGVAPAPGVATASSSAVGAAKRKSAKPRGRSGDDLFDTHDP